MCVGIEKILVCKSCVGGTLKPQDRSQQMSFGSENFNGQAGKKTQRLY